MADGRADWTVDLSVDCLVERSVDTLVVMMASH
jgi:hypothetical protein